MDLRTQLIGFEGWRNQAYPDPLTHGDPWTCGVGETGPDVGPGTYWDDATVGARLDAQIARCTGQVLSALPWAAGLNDARQAVLIGMAFQLGLGGLVAFHNTLSAVQAGNWALASLGMQNSVWARQTPERASVLSQQMLTGEWPA